VPPPPDPGHYFDREPAAAPRRRTVRLTLPDLDLELVTDAGVFSADRVDPGTRLLLLDGARPEPGAGPFLDLGCGYGPIALALARWAPDDEIWAVDVNERARARCRENVAAAGAATVRVAAPDEVPDHLRFGGFWSNPPIRIGKAALHELLTRWLDRLRPDGAAHLVVQKHLGADSLARWLTEQGWTTTRRGSRAGYRLLDVAARGAR
jgi:16S rRNA (guanine1207-N2)-methyltransferase